MRPFVNVMWPTRQRKNVQNVAHRLHATNVTYTQLKQVPFDKLKF